MDKSNKNNNIIINDNIVINEDIFSIDPSYIITANNFDNMSSITSSSYLTTDTITISNIDLGQETIDTSILIDGFYKDIPFETGFPSWHDFQDMCKEYPALEKAFTNLKEFYILCKDDWEVKKNGENN